MIAPFAQFRREGLTFEDAGERRVGPHRVARPVPFRGKGREQPSVNGAPVRDRVVGQHEHVLPECITRPEGLHGGEVVATVYRNVVRCVTPLDVRVSGDLRARAARGDTRRAFRTTDHQHGDRQGELLFHPARAHEAFEHQGLTSGASLQAIRPCRGVKSVQSDDEFGTRDVEIGWRPRINCTSRQPVAATAPASRGS